MTIKKLTPDIYIPKKWVKYKTGEDKHQVKLEGAAKTEPQEVNKMGFEEVTGADKVWDINEESEISGKLLRREQGEFGMNYILQVADEEVLVWGNIVLNTKLARVKEGETIKIQYLGEVKSKTGRMYRDFKVFIDK